MPQSSATSSSYSDKYCLAGYFTDLNPTLGGKVYFNSYDFTKTETSDGTAVKTVVTDLVQAKYQLDKYKPAFVAKATWEAVVPYSAGPNEVKKHVQIEFFSMAFNKH